MASQTLEKTCVHEMKRDGSGRDSLLGTVGETGWRFQPHADVHTRSSDTKNLSCLLFALLTGPHLFLSLSSLLLCFLFPIIAACTRTSSPLQLPSSWNRYYEKQLSVFFFLSALYALRSEVSQPTTKNKTRT